MKTRNVARAVCLTPACIQLASDYVKNLSPNYKQLDPCTDFEEMICGGWRDSHPLTPGTVGGDSINVLGELSKGGLAKLRATLEGSYPGGSSQAELADQSVDEQNFNTLKLAFSSCMDNKAIEAAGAEPILDLLDRLQESFVGANGSDWTNTNSFLHSIGSSGLVFFGTKIDDGDPNKKTIQVMPNLLYGLSASAYQDPNNVTEYTAVLTEILGKLYPRSSPVGASDAKKLAERVIRFETDLSRIHANSITTGIKGAKQLSPAEASKLIPQFDFERIIRTFAPKEYQPGNMTVLETPLLANISRLLTDTPPETVKAYFTWRTIVTVQDKVIAPDVFDRWYKLSPNRGSMSSLERSFYCTYYISKDLSWLVARFFIESFFSTYGKQLGEQIIADIRHAYIEKLSALSWMDDETKKKAVEKVNKMAQRVGYPAENPDITSPLSLQSYYASLAITPSFFTNYLSISNHTFLQPWKDLTIPPSQQWNMVPTDANAQYFSFYNYILLPASIFQPPYFGEDFPLAINYAAFGSIAGHEVSHGFDTNGGQYDSAGNKVDWWGNETKVEYDRRTKCFVGQYDGFPMVPNAGNTTGNFKMNGTNTLPENLSDSAGLGVAYEAWQGQRRNGTQGGGGLPGLEMFTEEQLFFVAYANGWCSKYNEKGLLDYTRDVHSPPPLRVRGVMENSRAFREAFGCKVREPVCELW